ncbi:MAG: ElyC/SanA/YdcF family protein [Hyphomicrobiaceae bacterium]
MFFSISKIAGAFAQPSFLLLVIVGLGSALLWSRWRRLGRWVVSGGAIVLAVGALSPLGNILILPLEDRFPRPPLQELDGVRGVIVLGGSFDSAVSLARGAIALNESAERVTEMLAVARRLPDVPVVFAGGAGALLVAQESEASAAGRLLASVGVAPERVVVERRSRNTHENAVFVERLVRRYGEGRWLLITSAYHMPRAVGCFRKAGLDVLAWPVDHRTRGRADFARFFASPSDGLRRIDLVAREWLGLFVYWLTGRTDELWPKPEPNLIKAVKSD